jgi:hypothetical protein
MRSEHVDENEYVDAHAHAHGFWRTHGGLMRVPFRALIAVLCTSALLACGDDDAPPSSPDAPETDASQADATAAEAGVEDAATEAAVDPDPRPLIHVALWKPVVGDEDPYVADAAVSCPPGSFGEEALGGELVFYVRTETCPALTVRQASREAVVEGQTVRLRLFHFPLTAPEPSQARLRVRVGDDEVYQADLPIPSPQAELSAEWTATRDYARGTPIWFHVENHGVNEYALIAIERL